MARLDTKVALITGATSGIGAAIARLFVNEGATVIITGIDDETGTALATQLGTKTIYEHLDVTAEQQWEKLLTKVVKQFSYLDILVNNAGITGLSEDYGAQDPEHASLASWRAIQAVNVEGVFLGCKYAIKVMKNQTRKSAIINIGSRSALVGIPGTAAYAASKAAVRNHTKSVALYCAQQGYPIRCNAVHPAAILTPIWEPMLGTGAARETRLQQMRQAIPLGTLGEPLDVAYAVVYLASEEAKYVTGAELIIDGGILAGTVAPPSKE